MDLIFNSCCLRDWNGSKPQIGEAGQHYRLQQTVWPQGSFLGWSRLNTLVYICDLRKHTGFGQTATKAEELTTYVPDSTSLRCLINGSQSATAQLPQRSESTRWPLYIVQRLSSLNASPPQECPHSAMADALHLTCNHLKYCADSYRALILIRQECHPLYLCWFTIRAHVPSADGHIQIYQELLWSGYGYPLLHLHRSITSTICFFFFVQVMFWCVVHFCMSNNAWNVPSFIYPNYSFPNLKIFSLICMSTTVWPSEVLRRDFCQQHCLFPEETICRRFSSGDHNHTGPINPPDSPAEGRRYRVQHSRLHGCSPWPAFRNLLSNAPPVTRAQNSPAAAWSLRPLWRADGASRTSSHQSASRTRWRLRLR